MSGSNIVGAVPLAVGSTGEQTFSILGSGTAVHLVVQSVFVDTDVPEHNVALSKALLVRFGQ